MTAKLALRAALLTAAGLSLSGCLAAQAGAIERACAALPADLCIVSGGAAASVAPLLSVPHWMLDNIVLVGLHAAAPSLAANPTSA